ncbi:MAG: filamentous hemagglutinin N-terminal domain-containing protein [Nostoc sp.]|uniref:beta strand repeat-containing protein n=1 Tax=Nostoc sp. TaxID=1180 RepID=UPI002FF6A0ED
MNKAHHPQKASIKSILFLSLISTAFSQASPAQAQITPDNTLGAETSRLNQNLIINGALGDKIDGGAKRGSNLFHSFSEFNIEDGQRVYFANPTGIENILTRVTGGNASNIFGTLGVAGAANLFLINPNGIVFGQNARLDVQGSFVGTTANGVQFGNQGIFSATNPKAPPLLTINPSALFFNQINQGAGIQNNSIARAGTDPAGFNASGLRVADGKSLLLVGGNVSIDGGELNAYGGRVELGGLAAPGNVNLLFNGDNLSLKFPENVTRADVSLTNEARVYVEAAGGGDIAINARNIDILGGSLLNAGIAEGLGQPEATAGDITLNATGEIKVADSGSKIRNLVREDSKGNGGNIFIDSGSFLLRDGARLNASTSGEGNSGNVTVRTKDTVSLAGGSIFNNVEFGGVGNSGGINIRGSSLSLTDGAQLQSGIRGTDTDLAGGRGNGGNIDINVTGAVTISGTKDGSASAIFTDVETGARGNGGNINISSGSFSLIDNALLVASTSGQGLDSSNSQAGNITLNTREKIEVAGSDSAIRSSLLMGGVGNGGNIFIDSGSFSLRDGAQISASTSGQGNAGNVTVITKDAVSLVGSNIFNNVEAGGVGNSGGINIKGSSLSLTDGAQLQSGIRGADNDLVAGQGNAGSVDINVTGAVTISGTKDGSASAIFTDVGTRARGNGGNINISSGSFSLIDNALLVASTSGQGLNSPNSQAGNITLNATGKIEVAGEDSAIRNNVGTGAVGNGGNIFIDSGSFLLRDGARLIASTSGQGNAGNVTVIAKDAVSLAGGSIFNNVESGSVGNSRGINIRGSSLSLSDGAQLQSGIRGADTNLAGGQGNGGNVDINVTGAVTISGTKGKLPSAIFTDVGTGVRGNGGNITIYSGDFSLKDGAGLSASTSGQGNAGNVTVIAKDAVFLASSDIFSNVESGGVGKGGYIDINATSLLITDGARLEASTSGQGNAGNITIGTSDSISLSGFETAILSNVEDGGVGKGGNININAASLSLLNGAQLQTLVRGASEELDAGQGNAGNVNIKTSGSVTIAGQANKFISGIISAFDGKKGNAGNITIDSGSLSLTDGAQISSGTFAQGNGGNITIRASDFVLLSNTGVSSGVEEEAEGKGGNIDIRADSLSLKDKAQILTSNSGKGSSGDVNINVGSLSLKDGTEISTSTFGKGDAGNVNIKVLGVATIASENNQFPAVIASLVGSKGIGNGGNITIDSGSLSLSNDTQLLASTIGQGDAGNVIIHTSDSLILTNSNIFSTVEAGGVGNGGNIDIYAGSLSLLNSSQLQTSVREALETENAGEGNAGNINIKVPGAVTISGKKEIFSSGINKIFGSGIRSLLEVGTKGSGGNITIDAGSLSLDDEAQIVAGTFGEGKAGNVTIRASDFVSLDHDARIFATVESGGVGRGGNIDINASSLSLLNGSQLKTSVRRPDGQGDAGDVNLNVSGAITISGGSDTFRSGIVSRAETGTQGNGGNITINSASLSLQDGAQLEASTDGQGNSGNIQINVRDIINVSGTNQETGFPSALLTFTNSNSQGKGGDITVNTNIFRVSDGALLDAGTTNNQKGGDITANANIFEALNGGQLTTTTLGDGRAGKITVNATDKVIISGSDSNYNDRIAKSFGLVVNIGANSGLFVSSTGSGITGDIEVNSPKITLDNQGKLNAESASGNGGNIKVNSDLLLLRHGAQISTSAGTEKLGGNGGNININSKFIVAVPEENSDISANAFTGSGGNIQINSQGIFGIESRPKLTEKSDITASSELGVSGVTNINTPDNSSIQNSFIGLSPNVIDTNALIANSCISRGIKRQENSFTITGSGALRYSPGDVLTSAYTTGDVRSVEPTPRPWKKGDPIIEPQGLYRLPNGQLILSRSCSK